MLAVISYYIKIFFNYFLGTFPEQMGTFPKKLTALIFFFV